MPLSASDAQAYVSQALAAGLSQSQIDSFLANNPHDEGRLMSAFNLGGVSSYGVSLASVSSGMSGLPTTPELALGIAKTPSLSMPTTGDLVVTGELGGLFGASPATAMVTPAGLDWRQIAIYAAIAFAVAYIVKKVAK